MSRFGKDNSVTLKRMISIGLAAAFLLGFLTVLPEGSQDAEGWMSPSVAVEETSKEAIGLWMSGMFPGGPAEEMSTTASKELG